ncbi:calcium-translocating P-type ATPase, PMCA-type [Clostridium grantii]|uniref:P-type Ca(2+) transporter n=1 Tax=Clostridium grantii DSM 8605 TaxID=1121316 RepID=A0A1M5SIF0_9CLOT|nr:calcium-translocating P-type ATPase, PMCA-type [Clostridium grantii]SHH38269.1 Ca2+-transporting ATPase [Clostridium grantii DSM 8605]
MVNEKSNFRGLSEDEALKRQKRFGLNVLEEKKRISPFAILIQQYNDFIIWVLIGATIISFIMGEKADAITILIIVIMNSVLGFIQEYKTERSLEALKEMAAPTAKVMRKDSVVVIKAECLVPGDVVIIESGDRVPADCIIEESAGILMDESLLTGESENVEKNADKNNNSLFMGTIVLNGKAIAKVVAIGMATEMGKIAKMLNSIKREKSPLKEKLDSLGKILVLICLIICFVVTIMGVLRGNDKYEMFLLGVSLAVAAIPEGLSAIVTVALALGVSRMLKRNALVRKLPAVETLGCTSIICSDKTGTLTQNKMKVLKIYLNGRVIDVNKEKVNSELLRKTFVLCNDCIISSKSKNFEESIKGDATDKALLSVFFNNERDYKEYIKDKIKIYEIPFDSNRKRVSVVIKEKLGNTAYIKGAPEIIIKRCNYIYENGECRLLTTEDKKRILKVVEGMTREALRCIGAAYKRNIKNNDKTIEDNLVFIGIAAMKDPPREEVKEAVFKCRRAGIKPVMITGDHKNTAFAIAREIGIADEKSGVLTGTEIDDLSDNELLEKCKKTTVYSRVTPNHKLRIVRCYKKLNNVVAMTGDGVNDAPAVKEADIGIAMGISGTDVTKEASSMILLDDNFATIVAAVEEGRIIYNNIRKFIRYLLSCNLGEVLTMFLASLINIQTPLLPIQILFINLATDGLPAIALGLDSGDKAIMEQKPLSRNESIFARGLKEKIFIRGSLIGICTVLAFLAGKYYGMDLETCRTLTLGTLILSQLIHVFECRSEKCSIFEMKFYTNLYLVGAVCISITMLILIIYLPYLGRVFHTVPLDLGQWLIIIFFSSIISFVNSLVLLFRK